MKNLLKILDVILVSYALLITLMIPYAPTTNIPVMVAMAAIPFVFVLARQARR